jgi:DNA-directed RNA polymerase specialized sigma24 family protein
VTCEECTEYDSCREPCRDIEKLMPHFKAKQEIPCGGLQEIEPMMQRYLEDEMVPVITRERMDMEDCLKAMRRLPHKEHFIFYLSNYAGLNEFTISKMLSVSIWTVRRYKATANQKILKIIKQNK